MSVASIQLVERNPQAQTVRNLLVSGLEEQGDEERDGSEGHAGSGGWGDADFITLDPWAGKDIKDGGGAYDHVMVFVVGGGNYVEQVRLLRNASHARQSG